MLASLVQWLDRVGPMVFWSCAFTLLALDSAAVAAVMSTKSRALVNRWTSTVLAMNVFLVGTGVAIPSAMWAAKYAVKAFAPSSMVSFTKANDAPER